MDKYEIAMLVSAIVLVLSSIALVVIVLIQSNSAKGLSGALAGGGSETYFGKNKKNSIAKKLLIITIVVTIVFSLVSLCVASFQKTPETLAKELGYNLIDDDENLSDVELEYYLHYNTPSYINNGWDINHNGKIEQSELSNIMLYESYNIDMRAGLHKNHENCEFNVSEEHDHDHE